MQFITTCFFKEDAPHINLHLVDGLMPTLGQITSMSKPVLRIHDILVRIRIRGSMPLTNLDPDPSIYVIDLQDAKK
jgi:hypothetical protein